ncbi:MAG TPA: class I SAM-dependent methyltransferase [Pyrinomonadaceae bacterium]
MSTAGVEAPSSVAPFTKLDACWICRSRRLDNVHQDSMDFASYAEQDPELSSYTGRAFWLVRCHDCGFIQPAELPTLPNFFDRMYDQRWSEDWIEQEFDNGCKDFIFRRVLKQLSRRAGAQAGRTLLDIGAHVGRLIYLASQSGWQAEGVELNPITSSYATDRTRLPVHRVNARELIAEGKLYDAVTMIDVLEHIPDPVAMLRTAAQLLTGKGWLAVKVPCGPSQLLKERVRARLRKNYKVSVAGNMVHVNHFSPTSLKAALKEAGFTNASLHIGAPELAPKSAGISVRALASDALRLSAYYAGRLIPGGVHTPLALNLQAYAQKAGASVSARD